MIQPGSPAFSMPPAVDDQVRKQRDIARQQMEQSAGRSLEASEIGRGGLKVSGGGIIITNGGTFICDGDATFNGSLVVPAGSLSTAGSITAGASLNANSLAIIADATVGGTLTAGAVSAGSVTANTGVFPVGVNSVGVYNTLLTYGGAYSSQYVHVDGTMGYVPSSRRFKQDIQSVTLDPAMLHALRLVTFRYIAAVENLGTKAEQEVGLIAEEVHALGAHWLVDYDADGKPFGVKYERLALLLIGWAQDIEDWKQNVDDRLTAAGI